MSKLVWGSEEFLIKNMEIKDEYIRPAHKKTGFIKTSECDPLMLERMYETGSWIRATDEEVRNWKENTQLKSSYQENYQQ